MSQQSLEGWRSDFAKTCATPFVAAVAIFLFGMIIGIGVKSFGCISPDDIPTIVQELRS